MNIFQRDHRPIQNLFSKDALNSLYDWLERLLLIGRGRYLLHHFENSLILDPNPIVNEYIAWYFMNCHERTQFWQ